MKIPTNIHRYFLIYILKFILLFLFFDFITTLIIGLSVKGGLYNQFVHDYLDYVSWLRFVLLKSSNALCHIMGYETYCKGVYELKMENSASVRVVYSCIGYTIMIFWTSFVMANSGTFIKKLIWIAGGCIMIFIVNIIRISLLLISVVSHNKLPFNLDHHTVFNIIAYMIIIILIYFYDRNVNRPIHLSGRGRKCKIQGRDQQKMNEPV